MQWLSGWGCHTDSWYLFSHSSLVKEKVIATIGITILSESTVVAAYSFWRRKPLKHLLLSSIFANLFTQFFLWAVIYLFPNHYLPTLFISEIMILVMETIILFLYRPNRLRLRESIFLNLVMNLVSFSIGWVLPV
jgi:hypothetical protein